jgi:hypothetical protein
VVRIWRGGDGGVGAARQGDYARTHTRGVFENSCGVKKHLEVVDFVNF